jgi:hypothetical protein
MHLSDYSLSQLSEFRICSRDSPRVDPSSTGLEQMKPTSSPWRGGGGCVVCGCARWRILRKHANGCGKLRPTALVHRVAERPGSARQPTRKIRAPTPRRWPRIQRMRQVRPRRIRPTHHRPRPPSPMHPSLRSPRVNPANNPTRPGSDAPRYSRPTRRSSIVPTLARPAPWRCRPRPPVCNRQRKIPASPGAPPSQGPAPT